MRRKHKKWTEEEMDLLKKVFPKAYIARDVHKYFPDRNVNQINCKARNMGLKRGPIGRQIPLPMRISDKAYLAGIIDADGSISIKTWKNKTRKQQLSILPIVVVYNTNLKLMNWITKTTADSKQTRLHHKVNSNQKNIYQWINRGIKDCAIILRTIFPYLIIKKDQAKVVLEFCENRVPFTTYTPREFELLTIVRELNKRGKSQPPS